MTNYQTALAAFDTINTIAAIDDPSSDIYIATRSLLIDTIDDAETARIRTDCPNAQPHFDALLDAIRSIELMLESSDIRTRFSILLLDYSLCPMHRIDYAICFDDDDDDCATIRAYFPSHDT